MSKLKNAIKKFGQWKEHMMDLSDEMYFPGEEEGENPTMRRIRELEEELGLPPLDLAEMPGLEEDYLAFLEDDAVTWKGEAKKAQVLENLEGETKDYDAEILDSMARCLFVNAWADYAEQELDANFSQMELMDIAPDTPPESFEQAKELYNQIEDTNNVNLSNFTPPGIDPSEGFDKDSFGHYLCMEALGHGVSWKDSHEDHGLKLPYIEANADMDFSEATLRQMYEEFEKDFPEGDYIFDSEPVFEPKSKKKEAQQPFSEELTVNKIMDLEEEFGMEPVDFNWLREEGITPEEYLEWLYEYTEEPSAPPETYSAKKAQTNNPDLYGTFGNPTEDSISKVKAILSKMRPGEEIGARGMSRSVEGVEPIRAEQILDALVEEGFATKDGNWYSPANLERDSTWYSLVNEGR